MTDEAFADMLSGRNQPTSREELHAALDALLDVADADGGRLDGLAFWGFVADLARGRGIADGIGAAAALHIAVAGGPPEIPQDDPAGATTAALALARMAQWAMLAALLRQVTEYPGEIVPHEFKASMFAAAADNILTGRGEMGKGPHMDLLGLGTQRRTEDDATKRAARRLLVGTVYYRAELAGEAVDGVREAMMPKLSRDTWQGWVREVARTKRISPTEVANEPRAAAHMPPESRKAYDLTVAEVQRLFNVGWVTNGQRPKSEAGRGVKKPRV